MPRRPSLSDRSALIHPALIHWVSTLLLAGLLAQGVALAQVDGANVPGPDDQVELSYYLPAELSGAASYDPDVPTPEDVLGFQPGTRHIRHDQLVRYMEALAAASDRVTIRETGRTHEDRPLLVLTITSAANQARIEEIRAEHLALSSGDGQAAASTADLPVVVYMGYSVHGNEASGANAAPVVAYHLAAAEGDEIEAALDQAVVLLDPSLNPDGLARFAHWANIHRGRVAVSDPLHREHQEQWPSGRTNHYWFDLNRDWLLAQHPESQARLATFHAWRPNVLTDHHEMGTDSTFFFQPGVASRKNPLTPAVNVELTEALAAVHAEYLDHVGSLYYSGETFDDFYYGKGSTYPDVQGAVGILFEQASVRGHIAEAQHGPARDVDGTPVLTFPFAVRNQVLTSLSTLHGAVENRERLLSFQRDAYADPGAWAAEAGVAGWVVADDGDPARLAQMVEVLRRHGIEVRALGERVRVGGRSYAPGQAIAVPAAQRQAQLARSLFRTQVEFEDDTFYDVSTWTLPLSFGLPYDEVGAGSADLAAGAPITEMTSEAGRFEADQDAVAYAFAWDGYFAPRALYQVQRAGLVARMSEQAFVADGVSHGPGTVLVDVAHQRSAGRTLPRSELEAILARVAEENHVAIVPIRGGWTAEGPDLGSPSIHRLERPRIAILVGGSMSSYEAGQAWHLLDHRFGIETTLLDESDLGRAARGNGLDRYSHLVLVHGRPDLDDQTAESVASWVRRGGVVVAIKGSAEWAQSHLLSPDDEGSSDSSGAGGGAGDDEPARKPYGSFAQKFAQGLISGSIFEVDLDPTHPLAFGHARRDLPVFKNSTLVLPAADSAYTTVAAFVDEPRLSGYASDENIESIAGAPALVAEKMGRGAVVRFAFEPNFRAIWYGTSKLFLNSLFFSGALERRPADEPRGPDAASDASVDEALEAGLDAAH